MVNQLRFEIKEVSNGILVEAKYLHDDDATGEQLVCQSIEDNEIEAFAAFLRLLDENYGPMSSRYSDRRIYITVAAGDKNDNFKDRLFQ